MCTKTPGAAPGTEGGSVEAGLVTHSLVPALMFSLPLSLCGQERRQQIPYVNWDVVSGAVTKVKITVAPMATKTEGYFSLSHGC